jgi:hypothetical protein
VLLALIGSALADSASDYIGLALYQEDVLQDNIWILIEID